MILVFTGSHSHFIYYIEEDDQSKTSELTKFKNTREIFRLRNLLRRLAIKLHFKRNRNLPNQTETHSSQTKKTSFLVWGFEIGHYLEATRVLKLVKLINFRISFSGLYIKRRL